MASNYPTSLDNFTNPTSNDSLNSPSHSLQHANINDAVEAIEAKLGIGASPAGSATSGYVLTAGTGGTTTWSALPASAGLIQVVPTSVTKGASGSASVSTGGAVTFSGTESIALNGCFTSTYDYYRVLCTITASSTEDNLNVRLRAAGTDNSTANSYQRQLLRGITSTVSTSQLASNLAFISQFGADTGATFFADFFNPFLAAPTKIMSNFMSEDNATSVNNYIGMSYIFHNQSTSYDGFNLLALSGTITGTIRVYGYKNG